MAAGEKKAGSEKDGGAPAGGAPPPSRQLRELYEQAEARAASALGELVSKPSCGRLMAMSAENLAVLSSQQLFDRAASDYSSFITG